ncbi:ABC transporter ATP-binding protein [Clostridium botulinum]|nr:ABC transporter ATP-binding protein [Clostridium botulinum]NFA40958.1 ABC transporter ATP-binding protein [Clostridium botulinum]NFA75955.1 ABC transporter ATP-binding protein [Clostridium botulinum]NFB51199.1 ABC transporter ATP-binding protein [Clostridium botulinum]NFD17286.1 ABC transporter ATP-binding protein [Clostridium botulinum]
MDKLEDKLDFLLSQDASNLSTGQKQHLSLAIIFLYFSEVIILDKSIGKYNKILLCEKMVKK